MLVRKIANTPSRYARVLLVLYLKRKHKEADFKRKAGSPHLPKTYYIAQTTKNVRISYL